MFPYPIPEFQIVRIEVGRFPVVLRCKTEKVGNRLVDGAVVDIFAQQPGPVRAGFVRHPREAEDPGDVPAIG